MINSVDNLMDCLDRKGWKRQKGTVPKEFKTGYPFFLNDEKDRHAMIATSVDGDEVFYAGHTKDRCKQKMSQSTRWIFYYLPEN